MGAFLLVIAISLILTMPTGLRVWAWLTLGVLCILRYAYIYSDRYIMGALKNLNDSRLLHPRLKASFAKKKDLIRYYRFKTIAKYQLDRFNFTIAGSYNGHQVQFFQIRRWFKKYSVAMLVVDRYVPNFRHIHITTQTILDIGADHDLEWIEFNQNFKNKFEDPREAREVLTPTFMESLVSLKKKYGAIDIEYFADENYQIHALVVLRKGYIFKKIKLENKELDDTISELNDYLNECIKLKEGI